MPERGPCSAGRTAHFGGRWREPCNANAVHYIASPGTEPIALCDQHFRQVSDAGLVKEPNIGEEEFQRREAQRIGSSMTPKSKRRWFRGMP